MSAIEGAIAVNRFGMGARNGDIAEASRDPRGWLKAQIRADAAKIAGDGLQGADVALKAQRAAYAGVVDGKGGLKGDRSGAVRMVIEEARREAREGLQQEVLARTKHTVTTPDGFAERWARFWANHFTVANRNVRMVGLVGPFEREAIRPNVFGSFTFLLGASTFHPAMLVYLDAFQSIGPSTMVASRRKRGLDENLAREVLELHTVGVSGGYTQADVIEFAKALTGFTINQRPIRPDLLGKTVFEGELHEPGARTIMGVKYPQSDQRQAEAVLGNLARHPSTARHIATKLVRHFVADDPPEADVARLAAVFRQTDGDLAKLAAAVIDLDSAWTPQPRKFKSPEELLMSAARATDPGSALGKDARAVYVSLAQTPFSAPSPQGWPDEAAAWSGPDGVVKRLEWANAAAARLAARDQPNAFIDRALGETATARTRQAVSRAETAQQGFTLALMSPEFQRR